MSARKTRHAYKSLNLLGNSKHAVRVPEGQFIHDNRTPIVANRNLVIGLYGLHHGERGWRGVYNTYNFGGAGGVQKSSQIVCEFLPGILRDRRRFVCLTISEHIGYNYTITRLNPRADLVPPAVPICLLTRGFSTLSGSTCHTRYREIRVPRAGRGSYRGCSPQATGRRSDIFDQC